MGFGNIGVCTHAHPLVLGVMIVSSTEVPVQTGAGGKADIDPCGEGFTVISITFEKLAPLSHDDL